VILPPVATPRCFVVEMPVKFRRTSRRDGHSHHNIIQLEKPASTHYYLRLPRLSEGTELREFFHIGLRSGIGIRRGDRAATARSPGGKAALGPASEGSRGRPVVR
jgi:hypothetical protein